ncbi:uncharacterized protein LOC135169794 [Diachasmimorpha longicaudata]|uniref:uncharacterized protein LOC135169794 n=1 Tax=Diachasmimorpha longicaudata TaxID=58733 RepID=UPI0030B8C24C
MKSTIQGLPMRITFFFLFIAGFGIAKTDRDRKLLNFCLMWSCSTVVVAFSVTIVDLYYVWGSFNDMAYSAVNLLTDIIINAKFFTFMFNRPQYEHLLQIACDSLWAKPRTEFERRVLKECENQAMFFVILFATAAQTSGIIYFIEPVLLNIQNNSTDVKERLFPFKIWFNLPIYETPNFQMFFLMEMFVTYHSTILYFCFDNYLALVNLFITGQFAILKYRLEILYNHNIESVTTSNEAKQKLNEQNDSLISISEEFKNCIKQHQYLIEFVEQLENIYTMVNLASVLSYSLIICLAGYQLIMPGNSLMRRIKFVVFISGCLTQLLSFSFTCNNVSVGSVNISEGPYNSSWYIQNCSAKGRSLTRDLILTIMRSQRPCCLTAAGFFPVTLDTLKSVLTTAFSYLTLIRQSIHPTVPPKFRYCIPFLHSLAMFASYCNFENFLLNFMPLDTTFISSSFKINPTFRASVMFFARKRVLYAYSRDNNNSSEIRGILTRVRIIMLIICHNWSLARLERLNERACRPQEIESITETKINHLRPVNFPTTSYIFVINRGERERERVSGFPPSSCQSLFVDEMTFDSGEILPVKISFFLLYISGFGIPETYKERQILNLWALYTILMVCVGVATHASDLYHEWGSLQGVTYAGMAILVTTVVSIKYFTILMKRPWYESLMRLARDTLWTHAETDHEKTVMKKCEKHALIYVSAFAYLAGSSAVLYIVEPMIYNSLNNITTPRDRMLIFKIWQDWPVYETPNFEMVYILQALVVLQLSALYSTFESFLVLVNTFITGQFSLLRYRLEILYNNQLDDRVTGDYMRKRDIQRKTNSLAFVSQEFKSCIRQHQFLIYVTEELEGLYTVINLASVLVHSILICLCGYQIIMPDNALVRRVKCVVFATGCISQLFFFSFTCTNLTFGSLSVGDGPYNSAWYNANSSEVGRSLTKDYSIMIMRAQRPCRLTGGGFFYVTLDTVKSVLTTAFSYLTVIRQSSMAS